MIKHPNAYLSSRPHVPEFIDLAHAAVMAIDHPDFAVSLRQVDEDGGLAVAIASETRHHAVPARRLAGDETMLEVLGIAWRMIAGALIEDLDYRFKVNGAPIFARGAAS